MVLKTRRRMVVQPVTASTGSTGRKTILRLLFVAFAVTTNAFAEEIVITGLIVAPIDQIDVPAQATGVLALLEVREGESVVKTQTLARLDDSQVLIEAERAETLLRINQQTSASPVELDLARKTLERTEQIAREQSIAREISYRKSTNLIRVRAAEKSQGVASNELKRAVDARQAFVDSVSRSEIDSLTLAFQRSELETQQAVFEQELDKLALQSEDASAIEQKLAIEQSQLGVQKALADLSIAKLKVKSAEHESQLAQLALKRHRVDAPIDGIVIKVHRRPGQWVQIGEPILELVRLDRLRAQGFVKQELAAKLRSLPKISVEREDDDGDAGDAQSLLGEIVFVMPEVDPVNGEVEFWVEFENPSKDVLPGMRLTIQVQP